MQCWCKKCECFRSLTMVLDIDQFRVEKGGNPEKIKENQKKRFCDEGKVTVIWSKKLKVLKRNG